MRVINKNPFQMGIQIPTAGDIAFIGPEHIFERFEHYTDTYTFLHHAGPCIYICIYTYLTYCKWIITTDHISHVLLSHVFAIYRYIYIYIIYICIILYYVSQLLISYSLSKHIHIEVKILGADFLIFKFVPGRSLRVWNSGARGCVLNGRNGTAHTYPLKKKTTVGVSENKGQSKRIGFLLYKYCNLQRFFGFISF